MKIYYTKKFISSYRKLPFEIKLEVEKKEKIFIKNPFDPRLKTHKLSGKQKEYWAYSITQKYRIKFLLLNKNEVVLLKAGTHNIYRR